MAGEIRPIFTKEAEAQLDKINKEISLIYDNVKQLDKIQLNFKTFKEYTQAVEKQQKSTDQLSSSQKKLEKATENLAFAQSQEGKDLFIFDEPTTGLHMADVELLLTTFQKLLSLHHSLIVIEHNLDLIRRADYIIDLGPEGGEEGGRIVAEGDLKTIMASPQSYTGRFLKQRLQDTPKS